MRHRSHLYILLLSLGILILTFWNCKEKPVEKAAVQKEEKLKKNSKTLKEIAKFADLILSDTTDITTLMSFKEIDENGRVMDCDAKKAEQLFKSLTNSKSTGILPMAEIKNSDHMIFGVKGRGFGAGIWAKLLVNRTTGEIQKIEFDHTAESEGYGAGITKKSFGDQFLGIPLEKELNSFSLIQDGQIVIEGKNKVDGIAGATATSRSAISMLNEGLYRYAKYLQK